MNNRHLYILASMLSIIGLGLFAYKFLVLKFPIQPQAQTNAWDIEARVRFHAADGPVKVYLYIPNSTSRHAIVDEQFISRGYGMSILKDAGNREVVWSVRNAKGEQVLYYRATVRPGSSEIKTKLKPPKLQKVEFTEAESLAAEAVLAEVRAQSADTETLITALIKRFNVITSEKTDDNIKLLLGGKVSTTSTLDACVRLLVLAGIPARSRHGIRLQKLIRNAQKQHWLEVYHDGAWHAYNPATAETHAAEEYLAWWHGSKPLIRVKGGTHISSQISVGETRESALLSATWRERFQRPLLYEFSLFGLPIETQAVYHVLLTVPLGVFLLVIIRNIIGIKTFGTFMPVLIAMAFRETQLLWGIFLFTLVIGLGLSVRFYLERLKLLLVPRLAAVLIVVIVLMALISILSQKLGMHRGLSVALFPMVILTMTIERMSIVWDERGAAEALQQGSGSMLVAALAYLVMNIAFIQHIIFVFPELLLLLLAATLLLGRYSGYRLLELWRFRALAK